MTTGEVVNIVEKFLTPNQPQEFHLDVSSDGARYDSGWWYIVVRPSSDDIRSHQYYTILSKTEDDIEAAEHLKVLLVPAIPD
jgi:hypothetical protein